ncbi:Degradation activator [Luteitalea pratensis]|uniref:Degradation activator n=1 Tax=Luteitalea pratensis TaxID=1855912 RepID=A0A143PVX4_LUTPR|nr:LacI family DNA-binding transcriptional regulator [Luteitalea pratensis]AMY11939.1 Degradation activator [Luteitalea pratensis]
MTLEEVARRARVSTATVSRVLNDTGPVKPATRARVLKIIQEVNYSPNLHAQSLAGGRSRSLGVIVSNIENPFFLDIHRTVEAGAHAAGYDVVMANTGYSPERLVTSIRLMLGRRLAGLAVIVSEMDATLIQELSSQRIPVVFYDVGTPRRNITNIRVDYRVGMAKVASYLYSLGHRRVGYVGHHATLGPIHERVQALREATGRHSGFEVETAADADSLEGGREAARTLLSRSTRPTALVCVNDLMAVGAMREVRARGLRIPEDVSVTGFDNVTLSQYAVPALTTVDIPREQIGRTIVECLMRTDVPREREFVIEPELIVRNSTGPVTR